MIRTPMQGRQKVALGIAILFVCSPMAWSALTFTMLTGDWNVDLTSLVPVTAGDDFTASVFTSANNQVRLRIRSTKAADPKWKVTVQRTTASLYSSVGVWIQMTNTLAGFEGGTSYVEIVAAPTDFFWAGATWVGGAGNVTARCQLQLTGLTVPMGPNNTTRITYTFTTL